ncbi:MAG: DUF368 domain-containing protein [Clostridia bacterium]|nr:DUF368 domain-containing protein [Clostridia bacterium]MBR3255745.1 DUF368 domain-containing protein [Clostridia bacterium]
MEFFSYIIKGIAIGAGAIVPGVSSGVICVILGIYEKLIDCVLNLFKNFKKSIKLLLPLSIGIIIGMIIVGKVLNCLLNAYPNEINFVFIGLVIGCVPSLFKQANSMGRFKISNLFFLFIALGIGLVMVILERNIITSCNTEHSTIYLIISGMCMSLGVIIPGVSSTVILMLLGVYNIYLNSIAGAYLPVLMPIGIGLITGSLICMRIIKILLNKFHSQTFYSIIGFTLGSVFVLYPGITFDLNGILCILLFALSWMISSSLESS